MTKRLTVKKASEISGVSNVTIYKAIKSGKLKAKRYGGGPMKVLMEDLNKLFPSNDYKSHKDAMIKSLKQENAMLNAKLSAKDYVSPTDADIGEAGDDWKKGVSNAEYRKYWDNKFEELAKPLPLIKVEEMKCPWPQEKSHIDFSAQESEEIAEYILSIKPEDIILPVMEVEEIEVINIELSDYPLPENVTTYDWWWA